MRRTFIFLPVAALAVGFLAACSKDDGGDEKGDGGATQPVTIAGQVSEFALVDATSDAGAAVPIPISGAEVCVMEQPDIACATTDNTGSYQLGGVPASADLGLVLSHDTHFDVVALLTTTGKDVALNVTLPSDALATAFAGIVGVTYPNATASVVSFFAFTPTGEVNDAGLPLTEPLSGVEVALTPNSGIGPIYTTPRQFPDRTLTETQVGSSLGFFANVEPGDYEVTFTHPTKTKCTPQVGFGWATTASNKLKVVAVAGKLTATSVICQ